MSVLSAEQSWFIRLRNRLGDAISVGSAPVAGALPVELQVRFRELKSEYALMHIGEQTPPVIERLLELDDTLALLSDLFVLERGYAAALPDSFVPGAVQRWRESYRAIVGDAQYADYLSTKPVDPGDGDLGTKLARLRADLCWLIDRVHYLYTVVPAKEQVQNRISYRLAWLTILSFVILSCVILVVTYPFGDSQTPLQELIGTRHLWGISASTILAAMFFGLLGGFISAQTRLQTPTGTEPFFKKQELWESRWIVNIISPLSGAVFALILYFIFASRILGDGAVFPSFNYPKNDAASGLGEFFTNVLPAGGASFAKILVWSFIAGFAERFVPNVLNRLASDDYFGTQKTSK
jgi:hypothetical protein